VILAELEVFHSRPIAPTRRVAIGRTHLPVDPAPGFGGLLLGGIVAGHIDELDPELFDDLHRLTLQLEAGRRIPQPRLRHRFQTDRVGLTRSVHRLVGEGEDLEFDFEVKGAAAQHILAAVYAAGALPPLARAKALAVVRLAMRWAGPLDRTFVAHLSGLDRSRTWSARAVSDPIRWAMATLALDDDGADRIAVQRRFREMLREAHPDHGAENHGAADRIADLTEARRILLAR
jgi:hypothetical protein